MFSELFKKYKEAYADKKTAEVQKLSIIFWNENKLKENFECLLKNKFLELENAKKRRRLICTHFGQR